MSWDARQNIGWAEDGNTAFHVWIGVVHGPLDLNLRAIKSIQPRLHQLRTPKTRYSAPYWLRITTQPVLGNLGGTCLKVLGHHLPLFSSLFDMLTGL